jgi:hypothetical protein
MKPIKTRKTEGYLEAPKRWEQLVGHLPYFREGDVVYSVWEFEDWERKFISDGGNVVLGQMGEPIHPMSLGVIGGKTEKSN